MSNHPKCANALFGPIDTSSWTKNNFKIIEKLKNWFVFIKFDFILGGKF